MRNSSGIRITDLDPMVWEKSENLSMVIVSFGRKICEMVKREEW